MNMSFQYHEQMIKWGISKILLRECLDYFSYPAENLAGISERASPDLNFRNLEGQAKTDQTRGMACRLMHMCKGQRV